MFTDRYTLVCLGECGYLIAQTTKRQAFVAAQRLVNVHRECGGAVAIFDRYAKRSAKSQWLVQRKELP